MPPFFMEIGKRVLELNEDALYVLREGGDDGDLADLLIMRAAAKLVRDKPNGVQTRF